MSTPNKKQISFFRPKIEKLLYNSQQPSTVDANPVLQIANMTNRPLVENIVEHLMLPQSTIRGFENLRQLSTLLEQGQSCLLLFEHYSNFDIPSFFLLLRKMFKEEGSAILNRIIAMATRRLNEQSHIVKSFAEAYSRISVYSTRDLELLEEKKQEHHLLREAQQFNKIAYQKMVEMKNNKHFILIFPSGTRYRPGNEESRYPFLQIDSFIKRFHYIVFVGVSGVLLEVDPQGNMDQEFLKKDCIVFDIGSVTSCSDFRKHSLKDHPRENTRKVIADAVFHALNERHQASEEEQKRHIADMGPIDWYDIPELNQ